MSVLWKLAGAVVTELNAETFSLPFTAVRRLRPRHELTTLASLQVDVVPKTYLRTPHLRGFDTELPAVDVGIMQQCPPSDEALADLLLGLGEELVAFMLGRRLGESPLHACTEAEFEPIYDPERLDVDEVFLGVVTCTFTAEAQR